MLVIIARSILKNSATDSKINLAQTFRYLLRSMFILLSCVCLFLAVMSKIATHARHCGWAVRKSPPVVNAVATLGVHSSDSPSCRHDPKVDTRAPSGMCGGMACNGHTYLCVRASCWASNSPAQTRRGRPTSIAGGSGGEIAMIS